MRCDSKCSQPGSSIVLLSFLAGMAFSGMVSAGQYLVFKGVNVTQTCLEPLLAAPSGVTYYTQQLNFICTSMSYSDSDVLVYDDKEKSCITFEDFKTSTSADIYNTYIMYTSISGSLESLLDAIFSINNNAIVSFDAFNGEVEQITATACSASGGSGGGGGGTGGGGGGTGGGGGSGGGGGTPTDTDGDGVADSADNCFFIPNPDQGDTDSDGVGDVCDNCVLKANTDQLDADGDGFGNACDGDLNNDLMVNSQDIGLYKAAFFTQGVSSADFNGDGIVNSLDTGLLKLMLFKPPGL